jgi:hypothetical protein
MRSYFILYDIRTDQRTCELTSAAGSSRGDDPVTFVHPFCKDRQPFGHRLDRPAACPQIQFFGNIIILIYQHKICADRAYIYAKTIRLMQFSVPLIRYITRA